MITKYTYGNPFQTDAVVQKLEAVSYTHLDVYKRQQQKITKKSSMTRKSMQF